jgi:hypothetical protein
MPASSTEAARIHERLNAIADDVGQIKADVRAMRAVCGICQPIIFGGNGRDSIDKRVTRLETIGRLRSKGFWVLIGCISAVVAGCVSALVMWGVKTAGAG